MSKRPRRNHSPAFKAKVALAAVKGELGNLQTYRTWVSNTIYCQ